MQRVKKMVSDVRKSALLVYPSALLARAAFALGEPSALAPGHHVVLAPPGGGNIGDQAMVEAFAENVSGPVRVVVTDGAAISFRDLPADRVQPVVLPHLIYGTGLVAHLRDVRRFRALMSGAASFSVVGADTMDGAYNLRASMRRTLVAELAARAGVDTRVLGFSWNAQPHRAVRRALRTASRQGVALKLRDPLSAERATADGLDGVVGVSDTVFSLTTVDGSAADEFLRGVPADRRVALVNASALVGRSVDQAGEYATIVRHLRSAGFEVLLVPHVLRPGADDMTACRRVLDELGPDAVRLVDRVLTPSQIKGLCERSDLVLTGRMHLAVMALSAGVPAITMATQGKVEGLMQLFGVPELCVVPRPGMADEVIELIGHATVDGSVAARVRAALPVARELSALNFAALARHPAPVAA